MLVADHLVSIPKRASEAVNQIGIHAFVEYEGVSIPKRASEAVNQATRDRRLGK